MVSPQIHRWRYLEARRRFANSIYGTPLPLLLVNHYSIYYSRRTRLVGGLHCRSAEYLPFRKMSFFGGVFFAAPQKIRKKFRKKGASLGGGESSRQEGITILLLTDSEFSHSFSLVLFLGLGFSDQPEKPVQNQPGPPKIQQQHCSSCCFCRPGRHQPGSRFGHSLLVGRAKRHSYSLACCLMLVWQLLQCCGSISDSIPGNSGRSMPSCLHSFDNRQ